MTTKQYETLAKQITGLTGKYVGKSKIKLEDGSIIDIGETIALQTVNNEFYGSILYRKQENGEWESVSMSGYEKLVHENTFGELLDEVYTFSEACEKYGLESSTLRRRISYEREKENPVLVEGRDYRQSGKTWLITKEAMERVYKSE